MDRQSFEKAAQECFEDLPPFFGERLENVYVVVEDSPSPDLIQRMKLRASSMLLGLYEGVPINKRGTSYGAYPILPDRITLFRENILRVVDGDKQIREKIREVLIHEIGHHFGMSEEEIRRAGY